MKKPSFFLVIFVSSCSIAPRINVTGIPASNLVTNGKIFATAYQQHAAEYRALCFQAYNIAHEKVDEIIKTTTSLPKAIITDVDETVLNNSPYEAHQTLQGKDYESTSWTEWTAMAKADTMPGAYSFLKYASAQGLEIFYITNRDESERGATLKNLQKFNFPNADNEHIFLRESISSKEPRRKNIEATHSVVMLLGDNLADFSFLFDVKNSSERLQNVNTVSSAFGNKFIVLPNVTYGDWESSLYNFNYSLTPSQKDSVIRSILISY